MAVRDGRIFVRFDFAAIARFSSILTIPRSEIAARAFGKFFTGSFDFDKDFFVTFPAIGSRLFVGSLSGGTFSERK